jgi:hypothetical protein
MQRHDFDPIAFIFGVVFSGLGVLFMIGRLEVLNHAQWLWPGLLVLLGLAVLVGARGRGGARAARPAFESGSSMDPALEDDLLHSPMTTIDSERLVDTETLFTLQPRTRPPGTGAASQPVEPVEPVEPEWPVEPVEPVEPEQPVDPVDPVDPPASEAAAPKESPTEVLPKVDKVDANADTELLQRPQAEDH